MLRIWAQGLITSRLVAGLHQTGFRRRLIRPAFTLDLVLHSEPRLDIIMQIWFLLPTLMHLTAFRLLTIQVLEYR